MRYPEEENCTQGLVGESLVTFSVASTVLQTAVNSDFEYSSMACFAIGLAVFLGHSLLIPFEWVLPDHSVKLFWRRLLDARRTRFNTFGFSGWVRWLEPEALLVCTVFWSMRHTQFMSRGVPPAAFKRKAASSGLCGHQGTRSPYSGASARRMVECVFRLLVGVGAFTPKRATSCCARLRSEHVCAASCHDFARCPPHLRELARGVRSHSSHKSASMSFWSSVPIFFFCSFRFAR